MARTGKGKNARASGMPAMTTRILEHPIFEYLDLIERHAPGPISPRASADLARPRSLQPSILNLKETTAWPCATWPCPGCGKQLISAVHRADNPPKRMFCTRACRERHA